jgi:hypothetical protein
MRRSLMLGVFVAVFALGGTTALANDNNDNRIDAAPNIPCWGLYMAGDIGMKTFGTPGFDRVHENDIELCHNGVPPGG